MQEKHSALIDIFYPHSRILYLIQTLQWNLIIYIANNYKLAFSLMENSEQASKFGKKAQITVWSRWANN